jgi:hypothetical protein
VLGGRRQANSKRKSLSKLARLARRAEARQLDAEGSSEASEQSSKRKADCQVGGAPAKRSKAEPYASMSRRARAKAQAEARAAALAAGELDAVATATAGSVVVADGAAVRKAATKAKNEAAKTVRRAKKQHHHTATAKIGGDGAGVPDDGGWAGGQGVVKKGDWPCPSCHMNVFASKDACFRCNTPNPAPPVDGKHRAFIGQLSYDATEEDVRWHFDACGVLSCRLLTDKKTKQSRGMAFMELRTAEGLEAALKLHQSQLRGRRINVEASAAGGGNTERRKQYIETVKLGRNAAREAAVQALVDGCLTDAAHSLYALSRARP